MKNKFALLCLLAAPLLHAHLLPEAMRLFPAQTTSLEYDNLKLLRAVPNYRQLRRQYSGEALQRTLKDLLALGISEDQLQEVVTASGLGGYFFGLVAGDFHFDQNGPASCSPDGICFLSAGLNDGHLVFGSLAQVTLVSEVASGRAPSLRTNAAFANLTAHINPLTPVFGIAPGRELSTWVVESALFANIDLFSYAVKIDGKAHMDLTLLCKSETAGRVIADTLSAAGQLQRIASAAFPFEKLAAIASGRKVALTFDAPIPTQP